MKTREQYNKEVNRVGRIGVLITLILLFAVPIIFGIYHNAMPSFLDVGKASSGLLLIFVPLGIIEVLAYSPLLGSASYITFITGNIMNLKVPIATNAQELMDTTKGSEEADVITTLAIGVSAMVTIIMIALGVVLLIPLEGFMTSPAVGIAKDYVIPALFGCLVIGLMKSTGDVQVKGKMMAGVLPFILLFIVNIVVFNTTDYSGFLLFVMIPFTILCAYFLYKKGFITIVVKEKKETE